MRHLPVACVFFIKQTALDNPKTSIQCAHLNCSTLEIKRYYMCAIQSRDAKYCVSQARRRMNIGNYMPFIAMMIPRETQDFASLLGWRQHIFSTKQAALGNMKASFHCTHWHCFWIKQAALGNLKASFHCSHWHCFWIKQAALGNMKASFHCSHWHCFWIKLAALGNMKASIHCSHWHCFCIMKNTHLNRKSTFRQSTQTLQHNHHRLDKNECRESGYS